MASYGVPESTDGLLPWEWAEDRLTGSMRYWVVTVDPQGRPHALPVWGLWRTREQRFWFSSAADSLRARNLAANPHVVVSTEDPVEVVSIEGTASLRSGERAIAEEYAARYENDPDRRAELTEFVLANAMYEVTPVKAFGIIDREEDFARRATRWIW